MACDTFMKIAQKCRRQFVQQQQGEHSAFVEEIILTVDKITMDLSHQQVNGACQSMVLEDFGHMTKHVAACRSKLSTKP
jgi:hypothetical protein